MARKRTSAPQGLTIVVVREDLLGHAAADHAQSAFNYKTVADNHSMFNTPPTWGIYMAGLTFQWLKRQREGELTGIAAMEAAQQRQGPALLWLSRTARNCTSMQVDAGLALAHEHPASSCARPSCNEAFLAAAKAAGLLQLKGHKSVGGMRASLYNAMPMAGVQALIAFMQEFERTSA